MTTITRRACLQALPTTLASTTLAAQTKSASKSNTTAPVRGGLALNEDNSHYFFTRAGQTLTADIVAAFVDQYANTQIRELIFSVNAMRTSFASKVWEPVWHGYNPQQDEQQKMFQSLPPAARKGALNWVKTAYDLHQAGIDIYALWLARARKHSMQGWLSMRMNDCHSIADVESYLHSDFWRQHPEYWRADYRLSRQADHGFDYGHKEVRDYHFNLIKELAERYDFDGLELDWMRFGYHFKLGHEAAGQKIMTDFMAATRDVLNFWERKRGHKIQLGARIPTRPQSALNLGYDVVTWAERKLVDMLVVTPFWGTLETDIPIELWKQLLRGTNVTLAAGFELLLRSHPDSKQFHTNSLETLRGAASAMLERGADRIYLFNYMDSQTEMADKHNYPTMLREVGSLATMAGKPRRHVVTFADVWAPGEVQPLPLPRECKPNLWEGFRLHIGPAPGNATVTAYLGIEGLSETEAQAAQVYINGSACKLTGLAQLAAPKPDSPIYRVTLPTGVAHGGSNFLDFSTKVPCKITWVEMTVV